MLPFNIREQIADWLIRKLAPVTIIAGFVAIILSILIAPGQLYRIIPPALIIVLITPAWLLVRAGRSSYAVPVMLLGFTLPILSGMILNGGVRAPVFIGILPIVTIVYCLYGQTKTILFSLLMLIMGCIFVILESNQLLPYSQQPPAVFILVVYAIWLGFAVIFIAAPVKLMFNVLAGYKEELEQRKRTENELEKSEQQYRLLAENVSDTIWVLNLSTMRIDYISPSVEKQRGFAPDEARALSLEETLSQASYARVAEELGQELQDDEKDGVDKQRSRTIDVEQSIKGGGYSWAEVTVSFLRDNSGKPTALLGVTRDISDRKRAETEVMSEKRFSEMVINQLPGSFYMFTEDGQMVRWNNNLESVTGYSGAEIQKMNALDFFDDDEKEEVYRKIQEVLIKGASQVEANFLTKGGYKIPHLLTGARIESGGVVYLLGIGLDITEGKQVEMALKESEEKLLRLKKMESLGLLAGGVAHDLNNILSGIVSYPELLLMDLPEDSKLRKPIETMQESGHRAAAIVQDLLTVARGVATTKGVLNLNDLVSDYLVSPEFDKLKQVCPTVTVKANLDKELFNISGSHVHIRKVVMNLVSNASEAIGGNGRVTVSTLNRYIDSPLKGYDDVNIGEYVVLKVSDNGPGISPNDLGRIFEPFYTKKIMGRSGTGLGLAVVWNTMQDHKGYINVASDEHGTTFELYFPITRDEISEKGIAIPINDYKGNGETILVIDDMESQREISCKMIESLGYKALSIGSGEEAIEYLRDHTADIILLDMIMDPGMNGRQTYEGIIKLYPGQKTVIASGYADTEDVRAVQKLGAGRYIKKPLTLEKIGLAIKEELDK